jgi:hypothetical protein
MALPRIPQPLPAEGFTVPVDRVEYRGYMLGFLPTRSHNNLNPQLRLFPAHLAVKALRTQQYEYTALRRVDYEPAAFLRRPRVVLTVPDDGRYYLTLASPAATLDLLRFFQTLGLPLTKTATELLWEAGALNT